jgi:hypothetical protein
MLGIHFKILNQLSFMVSTELARVLRENVKMAVNDDGRHFSSAADQEEKPTGSFLCFGAKRETRHIRSRSKS